MATFGEAASELESISRHLRRAGELDLVRELNAAMRHAVDGVPQAVREGLKPKLPDRYAEVLDADLRISTSVRTGERNPGVGIIGTTRSGKRRKLRRLDNGVLEHPLWGSRRHWYKQAVTPGWFTGPAQDATPRVREAILQALDDISAKAVRKS